MEKEKVEKKNISILPSLWKKAERLSLKYFGKINCSGYIQKLLHDAEE